MFVVDVGKLKIVELKCITFHQNTISIVVKSAQIHTLPLHCALTQCEPLFLVKIPSLMPAAFQNGGREKIPLNPSLFVKCSTIE